jgi:hypothetical protein
MKSKRSVLSQTKEQSLMKGGLSMFRYVMMFVVLMAAVLLIGCVPEDRHIVVDGSGAVVTQERPLSGFDRVQASQCFQVDIRQGEEFSVVVRIDEELVEYLDVVKRGDTLSIGLKPDYSYTFQDATMQAEVTMPELARLDLSGASRATITGFESEKALEVELSGSSSLRGTIRAGDTTFDVSGSSRVSLTGSARDLAVRASGSSAVNLSDFPSADVSVQSSGASEVRVDVSGRLQVKASGASEISYHGDPTLTRVETSGSSSLSQEG